MSNVTITPNVGAATLAASAPAWYKCLGFDNPVLALPVAPVVDPFHAATAVDTSAGNAAGDSVAVFATKTRTLFAALLGIGGAALPPVQYTEDPGPTPLTVQPFELVGSLDCILNLTTTLGGAGALTTPSAAAIIAAWSNATVGQTYALTIVNSSSVNGWTLNAGSGVTITGTATIAAQTWRRFLVTMATPTTIAIQSLAMSGTF